MKNNIVYTRTNRDILEQSDGQKHPIGNKRHQMHVVVVGVSGFDTVEFDRRSVIKVTRRM